MSLVELVWSADRTAKFRIITTVEKLFSQNQLRPLQKKYWRGMSMTNTKKISYCMGCRASDYINGFGKIGSANAGAAEGASGLVRFVLTCFLGLRFFVLVFFGLLLFLFLQLSVFGQTAFDVYDSDLYNSSHRSNSPDNIQSERSANRPTPTVEPDNYNCPTYSKLSENSRQNGTIIAKSKQTKWSHSNTTNQSATQPQTNFDVERTQKQNIIKNIPWDDLTPAAKQKVSSIVQNHTLYHHMPTQAFFCDPEVYQYFLEHPDLLVGFWEGLGMTQISLRELDVNRYSMIESTGTVANIGVLYRTTKYCAIYAKGEYKGPFMTRKIDGDALLLLQTRFARNADSEPIIVCRLDVFVKIDSLGADLLTKLFAASLGKIADGNFEQTLGFVSHVSDTSAISAESVKRLTKSVKSVRPEVRDDFADVVDRVAIRAARRFDKKLNNIRELYRKNNQEQTQQDNINQPQTTIKTPSFDTPDSNSFATFLEKNSTKTQEQQDTEITQNHNQQQNDQTHKPQPTDPTKPTTTINYGNIIFTTPKIRQ
jgi:hypothetical protein